MTQSLELSYDFRRPYSYLAFTQPASIADEVWHLAQQPRDAWSFLAEVRPFHEPW